MNRMTREQKEHEIKLLTLILICHMELLRRGWMKGKSVWEMISFSMENIWLVKRLALVKRVPAYPSGGVIVGDNSKKEIILK